MKEMINCEGSVEHSYKYTLCCLCIVILISFITVSYSDTEHDFQTWFNITTTGYFNRDNKNLGRFMYWLEGQERVGDDSRRLTQTLGRLGLGYAYSSNLSLWLGYAWIYTGEPFTIRPFEENRFWEQLLWSKEMQRFSLVSRTRMEQRFQANGTKTAFRLRQLFKINAPFKSAPQYSLVSSDEVFWHKNDFIGRNGQGFDQNRLFLGVGYKFSPVFSTEIGYMNQYISRFGVPNFLTNIFSVNFFMNLGLGE